MFREVILIVTSFFNFLFTLANKKNNILLKNKINKN